MRSTVDGVPVQPDVDTRVVIVPVGARVLLVSEEFIDLYRDPTRWSATHLDYDVDARFVDTGDPLVVDLELSNTGGSRE